MIMEKRFTKDLDVLLGEEFLDYDSNLDLEKLKKFCVSLGLVKDPSENEGESKMVEDLSMILRDYENTEKPRGIIVKNLKDVLLAILKLVVLPAEEDDYDDISLELKPSPVKPTLRTFKFDLDDNIILRRSDHKWLSQYFHQFGRNRTEFLSQKHLKNKHERSIFSLFIL